MTATIDTFATTTTDFGTGLEVQDFAAYDFYKDIHKGIRYSLFQTTIALGSVDPADDAARAVVVEQVRGITHLLDQHAEHENDFIVPVLEVHAPELADVIHVVHPQLDRRVADLRNLAAEVQVTGGTRARAAVHSLYLELASFTSAYLEHQHFEERTCMYALADALPVDELIAIDQAIVGSIPPDELANGLSVMLPAMNIDDRVELLVGIREGAPLKVFAGICALAESVLTPEAWRATATRLALA
jgi:hemerythrin HHE cation binding domain-containing protein